MQAPVRTCTVWRLAALTVDVTHCTSGGEVSDYLRFDNGLLVEHWGVMDTGALMQQLTASA
jgi:hypothetical protein